VHLNKFDQNLPIQFTWYAQ